MSDYASVNGVRVSSISLAIPYYGAWVADVAMATTDAIPTQTTLTLGPMTLAGAVWRTDVFAGSRSARIVGGYGGWQTRISARGYANPAGVQLAMVLGDLASDAGEQVNVTVPSSVGAFFCRAAGIAGRVLREIAGDSWWIDAEGVTQVGPRATPTIGSYFQILDYDSARGHFTIATEALGDWVPGASFSLPTMSGPQTIGFVRHRFSNDGQASVEVLST